MYDEAQEKFKNVREDERFFFKIVKAKKRNPKAKEAQEDSYATSTTQGLPNGGMMSIGHKPLGQAMTGRLFEVKKYTVPHGSSSNKNLPSSGSSSSDDNHSEEAGGKPSSNESMHSANEHQPEKQRDVTIITKSSSDETNNKKKKDYSLTQKIFNIVRGKKKEKKVEQAPIISYNQDVVSGFMSSKIQMKSQQP